MAIFIPQDKLSEIKNAADIVDIISEEIILKKAGRNFVGLCPFHTEKTPSFSVSPDKQIFYCFGCGTGGNVFSFLMKQRGLSFPEAVRSLATRYGIDIPMRSMSPEQKQRMNLRDSLLSINRQATDFFQKVLFDTSNGKKALTYLSKRGIAEKTTKKFQLGYAPESWEGLFNYFSKKRIPYTHAETTGLIVARKAKKGFYDRFRGRIIFPIFDINSQVIGFGGRVLDDALPKYLNTPETPIYNKSQSLYGIHLSRNKCREESAVYVVEGYFDMLALYQHGIENTVASLGTALTSEHVRILKGLTGADGKVILVFDSDAAGINAAQRSIEIFDKGYVNAQILVLPAGHDPDSYIFETGRESFLNAAAKAKGIMSFLIQMAIAKNDFTTDGKIRIIHELLKPLASVQDAVDRALYVKELAERIDISESAILEKLREVSGRKAIPSDFPVKPSVSRTKNNKLERQIIAMMLQFPDMLPEIRKRNLVSSFKNNTLKSIGRTILDRQVDSVLPVSEIISLIDESEQKDITASLAMTDNVWNREGCFRLIKQFEASISRGERKLIDKIKAAEESKDYERLNSLLKEKQFSKKKATGYHSE